MSKKSERKAAIVSLRIRISLLFNKCLTISVWPLFSGRAYYITSTVRLCHSMHCTSMARHISHVFHPISKARGRYRVPQGDPLIKRKVTAYTNVKVT